MVDTDNPTMDQLIALPYLDMVVRETMRLHAPVPATSKLAMRDDVLPLSAPIMDCKGRIHHSIRYVNVPNFLHLFHPFREYLKQGEEGQYGPDSDCSYK
jgi:hypothetical protein